MQCKSCAPAGTCRELQTGLGEECGVFGAYDLSGKDVAHSVYYGLFALQHRGQESCGIAVTSTAGHRKFLSHKGLGLVNEVFDAETLERLPGSLGIGHVRICSPPFLYPCYFGTDVPSNEQLIAHQHTTEEIRQMIGADSLGYMAIEKLGSMAEGLGICDACFTGNYPMDVPGEDVSLAFEEE